MNREARHHAAMSALADQRNAVSRAWNVLADTMDEIPQAARVCVYAEAQKEARRCGVSPAPAALVELLMDVPAVIDAGLKRWERESNAMRAEAQLEEAGL